MPKLRQLKFFEQPALKTVKEEFNTLLTNKHLKRFVFFTFLLLGTDLIVLALVWQKLPPELPLFYSRPWGEQQLIRKDWFFILPLSCLIFNIANVRLASLLFKKELLLSQLLVWSSTIICLLTSITLFKIISIVL